MVYKEQDLQGETIGNYKIIERLGRGGMATVYKAHEKSLNRMVALKLLSPQLAENTEFIKRFEREAQAAASLNHPNIVQVYAISQEEGTHYFAMELIKGKSLSQIIHEEGPLPLERAVPIIKQVAEALKAAHRIGLVHRDIKPSNIMINQDGMVKVTDFGIAYVSSAETKLTQEGSIIGTPEYLSPEQCESKPVDGRSDIYSLGVTLYECLSGKTPYTADTPVSMLMKIMKGSFTPLNQVNPDVPNQAQQVVEKMMHNNIDQRYQNIEELMNALTSLQALEASRKSPVTEGIPTKFEAPATNEKSTAKAVFFTLMIAVVVIGSALAVWYFSSQHKKNSSSPAGTATQQGIATSEQRESQSQSKSTASTTETKAPKSQTGQLETPAATPLAQSTDPKSKTGVQPEKPAGGGQAATQPSQTETKQQSATQAAAAKSPQPHTTPQAKSIQRVQKSEPAANSVLVTVLGDENQEDLISSFVQEILAEKSFTVIDGPSVPQRKISEIARFHLVTSSKYLGSTTLQYYGSTTQQHTISLSVKVINSVNGRIIAGPATRTIRYTSLNVEENIKEALITLLKRVLPKMK